MKILDRYIAKNFLIGYVIAFCVLIGLRVIIELFVNLDEFAENVETLGARDLMKHIATFYALRMTLYFRDIGGRHHGGGRRVLAGPNGAEQRAGRHDRLGRQRQADRRPDPGSGDLLHGAGRGRPGVSDPVDQRQARAGRGRRRGKGGLRASGFSRTRNGSLLCSPKYDAATATLDRPTIITRRPIPSRPGRLGGDRAALGRLRDLQPGHRRAGTCSTACTSARTRTGPEPVASYQAADLLPKDIALRRNAGYDSLLSSRQLAALAAQKTKIKDIAQLLSQKHFRITDPLINLTMLMVSLPVLICRDPRTMKSAILVSFVLTAACFVTTFVCKMLATEVVFGNRVMPELWAWLPIFIFLPIALIELDSMKT